MPVLDQTSIGIDGRTQAQVLMQIYDWRAALIKSRYFNQIIDCDFKTFKNKGDVAHRYLSLNRHVILVKHLGVTVQCHFPCQYGSPVQRSCRVYKARVCSSFNGLRDRYILVQLSSIFKLRQHSNGTYFGGQSIMRERLERDAINRRSGVGKIICVNSGWDFLIFGGAITQMKSVEFDQIW